MNHGWATDGPPAGKSRNTIGAVPFIAAALRIFPAAGMAALLILLALPSGAGAREGIFAGIGPASQVFSGPPDGSQRFNGPAGIYEARMGDPAPAVGFSAGGGYGFNPYFALEMQFTVSNHGSEFAEAGGPGPVFSPASRLSTVVAGVRAGLPLAEWLEVFGRFGLGGYELVFEDSLRRISDGSVAGNARFSGRGFAAGLGAEVIFGRIGLELSYTRHSLEFDSVDTPEFQGAVSPGVSTSLNQISLVLVYHFP